MEVSLSSIELDMEELSRQKYATKRPDPVERSSEDDAAIAEAVAEIEHELQEEMGKSNDSGGWMLPSVIIAALAVGLYFLKFR